MNVTDKRVDLDIGNLAQPPLEGAPLGAQRDDVKQVARGTTLLGGSSLNVVAPMDLAKLLAKLGIETEDQRQQFMQQRLSSALTMIIGQMQITNEQQKKLVNDLADLEKKIKDLEADKSVAEKGLKDLEKDPEVIRIKLEIDKLNQMINSLKTTPEERKAAQEKKARLEKELEAKVKVWKDRIQRDNTEITKMRNLEAKLLRALAPANAQAVFAVLSALASVTRRTLTDRTHDEHVLQALTGVENLATLLGKERPDELAKFNRMLDDLAVKRGETAYV